MDHESAFFKADVAEQCVLLDLRELFSFGAGSWFDGADAKDMLEQGEGKWIKCSVNLQTPILLERKRMSEHLSNIECLDKPCRLKDVLMQLEDAGEAWCQKIQLAILQLCCSKALNWSLLASNMHLILFSLSSFLYCFQLYIAY